MSQERITTGVSTPIRGPVSRPLSRPQGYDRQSSNPCSPNPCGPNTRCSLNNYGIALCRCIDGYVPDGNTINGCKPQCTSDGECPSEYRCRSQSCVRVCVQGACGVRAQCKAQNHRALCTCPDGYRGDPNVRCSMERPLIRDPPADLYVDPCNPSPCGTNAECRTRGDRPVCSCPLGYEGDPLTNCRRGQCIENNDCPSHQVCQRLKCVNPCAYDTCGTLAECTAKDHRPVCTCPRGYTGNPLSNCRIFDPQELCNPSPCGANTNCKVRNDRAVCSCYDNYVGNPLDGCRPECVSDGECPFNMACRNNICVNPCRDACGENAYCEVVNSRAVCKCPEYYQGDPHSRCFAECISHDACPSHRACIKLQCADPCEGACGTGALCKVEDHKPICSCPKDYTGHPFESCRPFTSADLCNPNPCGSGADCTPGYSRSGENRPVCTCPTGYIGDPLISCSKGECDSDSQCLSSQACYRYMCMDPCYTSVGSVCGENAACVVKNHKPVCSCPRGYDGDARESCFPSAGSYAPGRGRRS